jgi:hypothetical protein
MEHEAEQLLILAKSQKKKALELIIEKVLSEPTIFKFSEFLDIENVQNLGSKNKALKTLKLFAYDNYKDYKKKPGDYLELNKKSLK